ncbi:MAG: MerR family transcriptional regulator [Bryobacteraceae bacterium]|nr:MerR family transcriptional regulator [Bryobacteraceae bacterium]
MRLGTESIMATAAAHPQPVEIPDKLYFRIGEVSRLTGVKPTVLRFWETEFPQLSPKKSGTNQRLYRRKDIETILAIKHLLWEKRYTIEGARAALAEMRQQRRQEREAKQAAAAPAPQAARPPVELLQRHLFAPDPERAAAVLERVRRELREILELLA